MPPTNPDNAVSFAGLESLNWLDNLVWHTLNGAMAHFSVGSASVRRFAPGFSPIIGFENPLAPDFSQMNALCQKGEQFYTDAWSASVPPGWLLVKQSTMFKMVWTAGEPPVATKQDWIELGEQHAAAALALAELTRPGPFGPRTRELGVYLGRFVEGELIAMAGERMQAEPWREISGVCTHPDHQGKGHARELMFELIRRQRARGQQTCLHVMSANTGARALYERMGFQVYKESVVRIIERQ